MSRLSDDQERVQSALQACDPSVEGFGPGDGALVTGWVVIAEWISPADGDKWLTKLTNAGCTAWQQQGYLHNALHTDWGGGE